MLSFRARLVKLLLMNRHLLKLQLKKKVVDWNKYKSVLAFRNEVEAGAGKFGKLPEDIRISPVNINELYAEWVMPVNYTDKKVMLYFHGGGYISGTCKSHQAITAKFVKATGIGALLFQYRLAPEEPFPAALNDAVSAYKWLLDQEFDPSDIVFVGIPPVEVCA